MKILSALIELRRLAKPAALCTLVSTQGSTPRKAGAKMIVVPKSEGVQIIGTIGGGAFEYYIQAQALDAIKRGEARLVSTSLRNDLAMCCGGEMTVFIEPLKSSPVLFCFGAGHIAQALCPLAYNLGFDVHVFDARSELLALESFTNCSKYLDLSNFAFRSMPWGPEVFVVVATHDHQLDQQIIENSLNYNFKYLALVGSLRKALMTQKRLKAKNIDPKLMDHIICPAGLDIKAQSPQEIAVAIAAQLIQVKYEQDNIRSHSCSRPKPPYGLSQSAHVDPG